MFIFRQRESNGLSDQINIDLTYSVWVNPPLIITAFVHPPSTSTVEFCNSETRACSF